MEKGESMAGLETNLHEGFNAEELLRECVYESENGEIRYHSSVLCKKLGYDDYSSSGERSSFIDLADQIEKEISNARYYREVVAWPTDENGKPWRVGDKVVTSSYGKTTITSLVWDGSKWTARCKWCGEDDYISDLVENCKRTKPVFDAEGIQVNYGDVLYDVITGKRYVAEGDSSVEGSVIVHPDDLSECTVCIRSGKMLSHREPAFDADGVPTNVGDVVWKVSDGTKWEVDKIHDNEPRILVSQLDTDKIVTGGWFPTYEYTHREPDTQEKIEADIMKVYDEYWECKGENCYNCPSKIEGLNPNRYYETQTCSSAQMLDVLRRQRELDARKGEE